MIIGDTATKALHAHWQTRESIEEAVDAHGVAANLRFLGVMANREKPRVACAAANHHVFPVRERPGDPEGYGMVAIEADAQELATVAYATGGDVDAVREGCSGIVVSPEDSAAFSEAFLCQLRMPLTVDAKRKHAEPFGWRHFGVSLRPILPSHTPAMHEHEDV